MRFSADVYDSEEDECPPSPSGRALRQVRRVDYSQSGLAAAGLASPRRKRSARTQTPETRAPAFALTRPTAARPADEAPPASSLRWAHPADEGGALPATPRPSVPLGLSAAGDRDGVPQARLERRVSFNESVEVKYMTPESCRWADDDENEQQQRRQQQRHARQADRGAWARAGQFFVGPLKAENSGASREGVPHRPQTPVARRPSPTLPRLWNALRALDLFLGFVVRKTAFAVALVVRLFFGLLFSEGNGLFAAPPAGTAASAVPFAGERKPGRFPSIVTYSSLVGLLCWLLAVKIQYTRPFDGTVPDGGDGAAVDGIPFPVAGTGDVRRVEDSRAIYRESTWKEPPWFYAEPGEPIAVIQLSNKKVSEVEDEGAVSIGAAPTAAARHPAASETADEDVAGRPAVSLGTAQTAEHQTPPSRTTDVGGNGGVPVPQEEHAGSLGAASPAAHQPAATEPTGKEVASRAALLDGENAVSFGTAPTAEHQPPASETTDVGEADQDLAPDGEDETQEGGAHWPPIASYSGGQTFETRFDHASHEDGAVPVAPLGSQTGGPDQIPEARVDRASIKSGAVPVMSLTSQTADRSQDERYFRWFSPDTRRYLRRKLWDFLGAPTDLSRHPVWALSREPLPENCWVMAGDEGRLTLRLGEKVLPREFVLHQPQIDRTAAPRDVEIFGVSVAAASADEQTEEYFSLGRVRHDASTPGPQRYVLEHAETASGGGGGGGEGEKRLFDMIQIRIFSNHGNRQQTQLCKFSLYD